MFALPFAYVGAFLAVDAWPGLANVVWVTVAMVGARTLAMSLNRLVDAELDARNPRTATRELPSGALSRAQVLALLCAVVTCRVPRRRLPARPDRALALADPRRDVRRLPVPEADHVAVPRLAGRVPRPRAGRRVARGRRGRLRGRRGRSAAPCSCGSRASTSSTRSSTSSTTGRRACTRGPCASASAGSSPVRALFHAGTVRASRGRRARPRRLVRSTGSASW